jgi:hypothetical protein
MAVELAGKRVAVSIKGKPWKIDSLACALHEAMAREIAARRRRLGIGWRMNLDALSRLSSTPDSPRLLRHLACFLANFNGPSNPIVIRISSRAEAHDLLRPASPSKQMLLVGIHSLMPRDYNSTYNAQAGAVHANDANADHQ